MLEAEKCQAIRLTRQFSDPLRPLTKSEYQRLKDSIKKVGQRTPVVLYANILVEGYHRFKAIKELNIMTIDIERMNFKTVPDAVIWKINNHNNRKL